MSTIVSNPDELVFNVGQENTEVKEVKDIPKLNFVPEFHPILTTKLPEYTNFATETLDSRKTFIEAMVLLMRMTGGIGLSASQVGYTTRMFVMDRILNSERKELLVCYNPEVIRPLGDEVRAEREGCLTFPGLSLQVKRPTAVEVSFQNENGEFVELELFGIDAKCFQHELDHMNGVLFTSKVSRDILQWERDKQRKLMKKAKKAYNRR